MAVVATVRFSHPRGALAETLEALPTASVRVLRDASTDPEHVASVFMFAGAPLERIEATLAEDHSVERTHPMPGYEGMDVFGIEFTGETELLAPTVTAHEGFSLEARRTDPETGIHGWCERWLFNQRDGLNAVWEDARERGFQFDVLSINQFHPEGSAATGRLTEEQRETLLFAYDRGYFEEPRQTSLEELAVEMGLSSTAVGGRIRRGVNELVKATVVEEAGKLYDEGQ